MWLMAFPAAVPALWAQQNAPHLAYALPAGGQRGATFEVKVGGQFLNNVTGAHITGNGIQATVTGYSRPMNGMQATQLRERIQELQKKPADDAVRKEIADIRVKLTVFNSNRNISPVLAETVTLTVTMAPDAEPGTRELRLVTPQGLSNPLAFRVGQLPEFCEKESIDVAAGPGINQLQISQPATNMSITLPATVNGRIKPVLARPQAQARPGQPFTAGDADRYNFEARQGQQLVVAASARELIPYLADAVPGWFQAVIALYDSGGHELAYDDDFQFHPDPVLHYSIPRDGEYTVEIKDALYRGREDFVYRITLGELPFVTGIFPLGGRIGSQSSVRLTGWNLPAEKLTMDTRGKEAGIYPVSVRKGEFVSNGLPFMVGALPESLEKEPNNSQAKAQKINLPMIVNGVIDQPGDWDVYSIEGRAGETIVAEVYARRLDSPLDSVLKLTDASGRQLAFNDDHEDKSAGLETHHADSLLTATLPAKGTFYLYLGDVQQKGGREYAYRVRISEPMPDFELRVVPSSINAIGGTSVPITVYALRKDGFSGDISLALKDAPRGFVLSGGLIQARQDQVRLTLTVPMAPLRAPLSLDLEGRATIQGREIRRTAAPAEDMMQAFAYRHLVPARDLKVSVTRRGPFRAPAALLGEPSVKLAGGSTARIQARLQMPLVNPFDGLQFDLSDPPPGIELRETVRTPDGVELVLFCDPAKAKAGTKGNLIISISGERKPPAAAARPQANRQRVPLGTLPAIPYEIKRD